MSEAKEPNWEASKNHRWILDQIGRKKTIKLAELLGGFNGCRIGAKTATNCVEQQRFAGRAFTYAKLIEELFKVNLDELVDAYDAYNREVFGREFMIGEVEDKAGE
jgi:hypothetical protein